MAHDVPLGCAPDEYDDLLCIAHLTHSAMLLDYPSMDHG